MEVEGHDKESPRGSEGHSEGQPSKNEGRAKCLQCELAGGLTVSADQRPGPPSVTQAED